MIEEGKKLSDLRVFELKKELEKRKLDTVGAKASLVERLEKAIKDDGNDPNTYVFNQAKAAVTRKSSVKNNSTSEVNDVVIKEEAVSGDELLEDAEESGRDDGELVVDEVGTVDEYIEVEDSEDEMDHEVEDNEASADSNNHDNEESINLTIGEDEQKLLHEEDADEKEKANDDVSDANQNLDEEAGEEENNEDQEEEEHFQNQEDANNSATDKSLQDCTAENNNKEDAAVTTKGKKKEEKPNNDGMEKIDSNEQKSSTTSKSNSQKDEKEKTSTATGISAAATTTTTTSESKSIKSTAATTSSSRNLWVSGLSSFTRASDLKTIFSKHGKVIGAKVVTNTRTPGTRCYGYVTMSTSSDASRCIEHLHRTELHGRIISVERTKNEIGGSSSNATASGASGANSSSAAAKKKDDDRTSTKSSLSKDAAGNKVSSKSVSEKKSSSTSRKISKDTKEDKEKLNKSEKEKTNSKEKGNDGINIEKAKSETASVKRSRRSSKSGDRTGRRPRSTAERERDRELERRQRERERERERIRQREILSYQKIREERERQRLRAKERELRDEDRRRREIRERQREEEARLAEERKKLALERERLEREKAELLRLERERQKLEREKIELERLELKRQQMKIMQTTRIEEPSVKRAPKRSTDDRYGDSTDRKRPAGNEGRFDAPPPPKFDAALASRYDKKRDDYVSGGAGGGSYPSAKRDDYSASKRSEYINPKRDDYSGSKRNVGLVNEYPSVPKRSSTEYVATASSKRGKRDEYKREVELRHIPQVNTSSSYHSTREVTAIHKTGSRYVESDVVPRSSTSFRRGAGSAGVDDRNESRNMSGSSKRYESSGSGYGGGGSDRNASSNWAAASGHSSHSGHGHSSAGLPAMKSFVSNGMSSSMHTAPSWQTKSGDDQAWRPIPSQDRYDRTYNERSGQYIEASRPGGGAGGIYGGSGRTERGYGAPVSSRYENGKY